jgi:outer membrane protein assembly factor BamD (BamD/ComL family)
MTKKIIACLLLCLGCFLIQADDKEAVRVYDEGSLAYKSGEYYRAANLFEDARILADSPTIKANALRSSAEAWQKCNMLYREFKAIEALLTGYPEYADFKKLTAREYELGKAFYNGQREPAYWHLRWIPWLTGDNKCIEIYNAVLKHAPFSPEAPGARLRLAHLHDEAGQMKQSLEQYRIILRDFPESRAARYAMLSLANGLLIVAEQGDGDGKYITEVLDILQNFRKKYPDASELSWVNRQMIRCRNLLAKRSFDMALYYKQNGKPDAARRYLAIVLRDYPECTIAPQAEKMLLELDKTFTPGDFVQPKKNQLPHFKTLDIPSESDRILLTPGKDKPYLVPVQDLSPRSNPIQENQK